MKSAVSSSEIISYYTSSQWLYKYFWSPRAHGMHVGFWDANTHTVDQAVENENASVLSYAHITDADRVLDAGCGVGGTSLYIGSHTNASVEGVSLVKEQIEEATRLAKSFRLFPRVSFRLADYTKLPYKDGTFDVVIGIESICHAYPKEAFLCEAYRVLKKGGRLVIADGYMKKPPKNEKEVAARELFCFSFALTELIEVSAMEQAIRASKFKEVVRIDKTAYVTAGAKSLYHKSNLLQSLIPLVKLMPFGWAKSVVRNAAAARASMDLLSSGVGWYGVFTAIK